MRGRPAAGAGRSAATGSRGKIRADADSGGLSVSSLPQRFLASIQSYIVINGLLRVSWEKVIVIPAIATQHSPGKTFTFHCPLPASFSRPFHA